MPRILHAADLHLSDADRDYGLSVLTELIAAGHREKADYLVFCGDLFDTFADAEKLRADFRRILGTPPFEFLFLPGNHEGLRRAEGELRRLDFGAATLLDSAPFSLLRRDRGGCRLEFLAVPHQDDYSGYGNWEVPPKDATWRIAIAHGVVAGMSYRGPEEESGGAALDPDLFIRHRADYAALGHIHGRRTLAAGGTRFAYPGSTRVWRKREFGPRGAFLIDFPRDRPIGATMLPDPVFLPFASAGEYRHQVIPLTLEGGIPESDGFAQTWGAADYVELEFTGLVEDERAAFQAVDALRERFSGRFRVLRLEKDGVAALPGISCQPIVRKFLDAWNARMPAAEDAPARAVWLRSRELALNSLKIALERVA
ncbi:MAG: metallophosphoesterase [Fibrobacteria bacterium]